MSDIESKSFEKQSGRPDFWIMLGLGVVVLIAVIVVTLRLLAQTEEHVKTVKETHIPYEGTHQWNPDAEDSYAKIKADVDYNPKREKVVYEQLELSERGMQQIGRLDNMTSLDLTGATVKDEWLHYIEDKPLRSLWLSATEVTDKGMKTVAYLKNLKILYLDDTPITDAGIAALLPLKKMKQFSLKSTKVTDSGVKLLMSFPEIDTLFLNDTAVTEASYAYIGKMPNMKTLRLGQTKVTPKGIGYLRNLKGLHRINMNGSHLGDEELAALARLPAIRYLFVSNNPFTDKGLLCLKNTSTLRQLEINDCPNLSKGAIKQLQSALPSLRLSHNQIFDALDKMVTD